MTVLMSRFSLKIPVRPVIFKLFFFIELNLFMKSDPKIMTSYPKNMASDSKIMTSDPNVVDF